MYSEHVSCINVVDTRTFEEKQVIRVAPQNIDQHIAGICFSPESSHAFVGTCFVFQLLALESNVIGYEIDLMARRSFPLGSLI